MPELAEVEYYRKQWNAGLGKKILELKLHPEKRIFRGVPIQELERCLTGATLIESLRHGKQMLFRFSKGGWLGIHLGMTGRLSTSDRSFAPGKHDHLVFVQHDRALVFSDPRLFGRVRFSRGSSEPDWWVNLPASIDSPEFDRERMETFLRRHAKLPIKGALLLQDGFPGIGNWMADEILWRARIHPRQPAGAAAQAHSKALFREVQAVSRGALKHVSPAFSDPPAGWLFHQRWSKTGRCPRDGQPLERATVGGRTTAWCPVCQAV